MVFLALFTLGFTAVPIATPNVPASNNVLTSLATEGFLWNTTSDFNNYESNNCTIESNQLTLDEIGITFDFTDDNDSANPAGWSLFEGIGTHIDIISGIGGHDKVVELFDNTTTSSCYMTDTFSSTKATGTVEFWVRSKSGWTDRFHVDFRTGNSAQFRFDIRDTGEVRFWGPLQGNILIEAGNWTDDTWHYFRVDFNCTSDKAKVWIDHTYKGEHDFYSNADYIEDLHIYQRYGAGNITGTFYIDAIDYSWTDDYFINRSYSYYGQTYYDTGVWTSTVQDTQDNNPYYNNITFSSQTPANTAVYISYQDSQNNASWSGWSAWSDSTISLSKNGHRYIQVRTKLTTTDVLETPTLEWINFSYDV